MGNNLALFYLLFLVVLLAGTGWVVIRQILKTRRTESRLAELQRKLSRQKGTAKERYELGAIFLDKKLHTQAVEQFQKALKSKDLEGDENIAGIRNALGFAYAAQEQYDQAIREHKEALKLKPDYVVALNNLGFAYERKQLIVQSIEAYEEALKLDPNNQTAKKRLESLRKRATLPQRSES